MAESHSICVLFCNRRGPERACWMLLREIVLDRKCRQIIRNAMESVSITREMLLLFNVFMHPGYLPHPSKQSLTHPALRRTPEATKQATNHNHMTPVTLFISLTPRFLVTNSLVTLPGCYCVGLVGLADEYSLFSCYFHDIPQQDVGPLTRAT